MASSRNGVVHVVWMDTRTGAQQIWTKRFVPGTGWTADQQLTFSTGSATQPSITTGRSGRAHLVWRDNRDGNNEIYYKEYLPATGWSATDVRLTTNSATQSEPTVDADPMDNLYVVWTDQRNGTTNPDIYLRGAEARAPGRATFRSSPPPPTRRIRCSSSRRSPTTGTGSSTSRGPTTAFLPRPARIARSTIRWAPDRSRVSRPPSAQALTRLLRNYPNPFNPATKIVFRLERDAQASLRIFDVHGRLVRTLVDSYLAAGQREVEWDGRDDHGRSLASGTYFM